MLTLFSYVFLLFLLGCSATERDYGSHTFDGAPPDSYESDAGTPSTPAPVTSEASALPLTTEVTSAVSAQTSVANSDAGQLAPDSDGIPRNLTETDAGCASSTDDATDTGGRLEEGEPCREHSECLTGLACGHIGDPQWRQTACLRLGRTESDCGGALGRLVFGAEVAPLPAGYGLCVGDIR